MSILVLEDPCVPMEWPSGPLSSGYEPPESPKVVVFEGVCDDYEGLPLPSFEG